MMMSQSPNPNNTNQQIENSYCIAVEQFKNSYQTTGPGNRINHIIAYYNQQIFVIGGTSSPNIKQDQHYRVVYWYSFDNKQWSKKQFATLIKNQERERQRERQKDKDKEKEKDKDKQQQLYGTVTTRSYMASCQKQSKIYMFGGSNHRNECNNDLIAFDMRKLEWQTLKNQSAPQPRQSAYLSNLMDSYLLLYGGINLQACQIYEHFHVYSIQTGVWRIIQEGNYLHILKPRYMTSICRMSPSGDKLFLFGGQYRNADGYHRYLSDFYEISITVIKKNLSQGLGALIQASNLNLSSGIRGNKQFIQEYLKIDCQLRRSPSQTFKSVQNEMNQININSNSYISSNSSKKYPEAQSNHKLAPINNQFLILIGGANSQHYNISDVWIYSVKRRIWKKVQLNFQIPKQGGIDCCSVLRDKRQNEKDKQKDKQKEKEKQQKPIRQNRQYNSLMRIQSRRDRDRQRQRQKKEEIKQKLKEKEKEKERQKKEKQREKQKQKERERQLQKQKEKEGYKSKDQQQYNSIFIYGGLNCYDSVRCDLYCLKFDKKSEQSQDEIEANYNKMEEEALQNAKRGQCKSLQQLFYVQPIKKCSYCHYPKEQVFINKLMIDHFTDMISFPFNAIGLFLQNAFNNSATQFCVGFRNEISQGIKHRGASQQGGLKRNQHVNQQTYQVRVEPFLHITENNNIHNIQYDDLKSTIGNFEYILHFTYHNIEKKVKLGLQKQHQLHQFGVYLKIGALRLGQEFLYITKGSRGQIRVFCYFLADKDEKMTDQKNQDQQYYQFCTYMWNPAKKQLITELQLPKHIQANKPQPSSSYLSSKQYYEYSYRKINEKFEKYLEDVFLGNSLQENYNHLLIFGLKQTKTKSHQFSSQLFAHKQLIDICYTPYRRMLETHQPGIYQSIDLSMRAYMSSYFLRSEFPKMAIKYNNMTRPVTAQICLQSFDLMARNKCIYEIDNSLMNIQIKLMELYFNPTLTTPTISFHNGILFYHKGRLVARHSCPIGELFRKTNRKSYNYFNLFGLLEVPQAIMPNIFRTEFIYNVMMEKLRSRLKFIEKKMILQFQQQKQQKSSNVPVMPVNDREAIIQKLNQLKPSKKTIEIRTKESRKEKEEKNKQKEKKDDIQFNPSRRQK